MTFKEFTKYRATYAKYYSQICLVVSRGGKSIYLTPETWIKLGKPAHVVLMADDETGRIAVKPASKTNSNAYAVSISEATFKMRPIAAVKFLRSVGIGAEKRGRVYPARVVDGMLVADITAAPTYV